MLTLEKSPVILTVKQVLPPHPGQPGVGPNNPTDPNPIRPEPSPIPQPGTEPSPDPTMPEPNPNTQPLIPQVPDPDSDR
jgi:hypothetical protein